MNEYLRIAEQVPFNKLAPEGGLSNMAKAWKATSFVKDAQPNSKPSRCKKLSKRQVSEEESSAKRQTNVERCRKYRERRRKEEANVYRENLALKRERLDFQNTITKLEMEVQELRGQGVIDVSKENELLRSEVAKHKQYVERIVSFAKDDSLQVEEEEEKRIMRTGVESAMGHIVGVMYGSMSDPSWESLGTYEVLDGIFLHFRYQLLPTGSTPEDAQRINIRTDCTNLPISSESLFRNMAAIKRNVNGFRKWWTDKAILQNIILEEVHPVVTFDDEEFIACTRCLVPKNAPVRQAIVVHVAKTVDLYPTAFINADDYDSDTEFLLTQQRYKLLISTTSDIKVTEVEGSQLERAKEFHSEGYAVKEGLTTCCDLTHVMTSVAHHPQAKAIIHRVGEDGQDLLEHSLVAYWRNVLETFLNPTLKAEY